MAKSKWGNVRVTASVGGTEYHFRSKLEYRWAEYTEFLKAQGRIKDWWFEDPECYFELKTGNKWKPLLGYLPDFCILTNEDEYEYQECKGRLVGKDMTKLRLFQEQYDNAIDLVMGSKSKGNAGRIEILERKGRVRRVIYADKIFRQVKGLVYFEH